MPGDRDIDVFGWVGHTVAGKYRVDSVVAEGGFGVVYRAHHLGFDTQIALKCLKLPARLQGLERDKFLSAFVEEGRLLHQLSRATVGIVQALDVGAETSPSGDWTPYLALEWLEGVSLEDDLAAREQAGLPGRTLAEGIALLESAARALAIAHERRVVHRDIKPANLFATDVGGRRIVKVVDFGIAKVMTDVTSFTRALEATGASLQSFTPQYGAPEQFDRSRYGATGPWTDVFALALVLVEFLTGRPALDGSDTTQLFISAMHPTRRPTPRQRGVHVSDAVEAVLARAVAVEPRDRFRSAGEFWDALVLAASSGFSTEAFAATAQGPSQQPTHTVFGPPAELHELGAKDLNDIPRGAQPPGLIPPAPPRLGRSSRSSGTVLALGGALIVAVALAGYLVLRPDGVREGDLATTNAAGSLEVDSAAIAPKPTGAPSESSFKTPAEPTPNASASGLAKSADHNEWQKTREQVALGRGDYKEAAEAGELAVALDPTDAAAWLMLGGAYQAMGNVAKARRAFNSCLKEGKKGPIAECRAMMR